MKARRISTKATSIILTFVLACMCFSYIQTGVEAGLYSPADYAFDYIYYADTYGDLKAAFGYNEAALRNHWLNYGIREGRSGSPVYDGKHYLTNNLDVKQVLGNDYAAAYNHFIHYGYKEKRISSPYYFGQYYAQSNGDLSHMSSQELIQHYLIYGVAEKRKANTKIYNGSTANAYNSGNNGKVQIAGSPCISNGTYCLTTALNGTSVLDIADGNTGNGANVHLWQKAGVENQAFRLEYLGDGTYRIFAAHSGKVLDIHDGIMNNSNNIKQWNWADVVSQRWVIVPRGNGYYSIHSAKDTNYVLDVDSARSNNGTNVQLYRYNGSHAQLFRFDAFVTAGQSAADGTYYLTTALNGNSVLDIQDGSTANGGNVHLWAKSGVTNQAFSVQHIGNGFYRILSVHSNKVLDISDGIMQNGQNIKQWNWANVANQKWILINRGNGYYSIHSVQNRDYVIDISGASSANGTNVQLYQYNGSPAQLFRLDPFTANHNNNPSSSTKISLNVPNFKQTDGRWKNTYIGNRTIGMIGCLLTSVSMKYSYSTNTTTYPPAMKAKLSFTNNDMNWNSVKRLGYNVTSNYNCSINQSIMSKIYTQLKAGKPVIIGGAKTKGTHWVVIKGYTGNSTANFNSANFIINDPNSNTRTTLQQFLNVYPTVLRLIY